MKTFIQATLLALVFVTHAVAAEAPACQLRGGSVVPLPAAACAKEGGAMVAPAAPPAATTPLTAAQRAIQEVLGQPVVDEASSARVPEGVSRKVKFDGCKLTVEEMLHLDYGNLIAARKDFRIVSTVDFAAIDTGAYGVLGKFASKGGHLKGQGVYLKERRLEEGNHITIAIDQQDGSEFERFALPGPGAYWSTPGDYLWMKDGYGYVWMDEEGYTDTGLIRIVYLVKTADDSAKLKQAFDALHAVCVK